MGRHCWQVLCDGCAAHCPGVHVMNAAIQSLLCSYLIVSPAIVPAPKLNISMKAVMGNPRGSWTNP